jgi:hypothetical protein
MNPKNQLLLLQVLFSPSNCKRKMITFLVSRPSGTEETGLKEKKSQSKNSPFYLTRQLNQTQLRNFLGERHSPCRLTALAGNLFHKFGLQIGRTYRS